MSNVSNPLYNRKNLAMTCLVMSTFSAIYAVFNVDISVLVAILIGFSLGWFLLVWIKKGVRISYGCESELNRLFLFSFSLNSMVMLMFTLYWSTHSAYSDGAALVPGGDAHGYFLNASRLVSHVSNGANFNDAHNLLGINETYPGFIYSLALWFSIVKFISLRSMSYPAAKMFVVSIASLQPAFIYLIVYKITLSVQKANRAGQLASLWGVIIYFASVLLRDSLIATMILCVITIVLSFRDGKKLLLTLLFTMCCVGLWFYRAFSLYFALLFVFLYLFEDCSKINKIILAFIGVIIVINFYSYFEEYLVRQAVGYTRLVADSSTHSLGDMLYTSHGFIFDILRLLNSLLLIIPPIPSSGAQFPDFILGVGVVEWYLLLPFFIKNCFYFVYNYKIRWIIFGVFALLLYGAFMPLGIRHETQITNPMLVIALLNLQDFQKRGFRQFYFSYLILLSLAILAYFILII